MSDINTKATVTLQVNGQQAEQTLAQLKSNALQLEAAIAKAAAAGNKADLKRLRKELGDTKKQIHEIENSTMQVDSVMRRLDRASPRELQKTLQTLNRQLDYMERGSDAWNAHIEKIKKVKAEIASVNEEIRGQEGWFSRLNRKFNDWQMAIMGAAAALTGLIMAGRKAVSAFADMDAEMASVRKYTGMTAEEVEAMNEEMKKIDTRSSREELNRLAQEAGRLGKTSQEDVMGFVRAADKINVALDELGDGATLTLSKLTTIFGDEERLGTEKALLSVGSVINELSQNCTASAPYLANFAQRLAGIGAQANMSIPQIMSFAAVLDSQGQKVEMSATALSKLIMNLFKNPARIAQATGMDLKTFTDTCVKDTNAGLLMLLERLHQLGDMSVLAPVFADMGESGARASAVISTLAGNLDMVKWEQEEAVKAFEEGTSVTKEFDVQNNTVQAGLDKARKRVKELAVELGEKLMPVMRHIISSSTLALRALSSIIDFISKYHREIVVAVSAVVAYTVAVNAATIATKAKAAAVAVAKAATLAWQKTVVLARIAFYAFTGQTQKATAAIRLFNIAFKQTPWGWIVAGITAIVGGLVVLARNMSKTVTLQERMNDVESEAARNTQEEVNRINLLNSILHDNSQAIDTRRGALNELKKIVPDYLADLNSEGKLINDNTSALDKYIKMLKLKAQVAVAAERLAKEQADYDKWYKDLDEGTLSRYAEVKMNMQPHFDMRTGDYVQGTDARTAAAMAGMPYAAYAYIEGTYEQFKKNIKDYEDMLTAYNSQLLKIEAENYVPTATGDDDGVGGYGSGGSDAGSGSERDRFASENEWKKKEEAINRIAYAKGEKDYMAFTNRMTEIEVEYNERKLAHTDLAEAERLSILAEYSEAVRKQKDAAGKLSIEQENDAYSEQMALLKQRFINGESDLATYEEASEQAEMAHLQRLAKLYADGSKEQLDIQKQMQDKAFANQKKHQQEYEAAVKKHQDALAKFKEEFFGDNPQERQAKYAADLALLTEVYDAEIAAAEGNAKEKLRIEEAFQKAKLALQKEYDIESADTNMNVLQQWNDDVMDFLSSETGQAIAGTMETVASSMSAVFQQLTSIVQAELEIQTAAIEQKYEREISLAEGNNYKVKRLEKAKEAEIARVKNEANKKMFAMQVIQAVAQTATGAINAYSSAAAIPSVGYLIAPGAAAAAVAAGMLQVAAIKKQQQASEATGYSSGGFTPDGKVDEAVGIVHAGEWVASQKLTKNPMTRPLLEALDYAQRNNTVGSLSAVDVSKTITAPTVLAQSAVASRTTPQQVIVQNLQPSSNGEMREVASVIGALKERLDEPFITVNTVTGDFGSKKAQDDYDKLIRNKTPKSRRS